MRKTKGKQLSFMNALLADEKRETLLIDTAIGHFSNLKYLRTRIRYSSFSKERQLYCHTHLSDALDTAGALLYALSRKTVKYRHYTHEDFIKLLFTERYDVTVADPQDTKEIKRHHQNVQAAIVGMFLAYKDILKRYGGKVDKITTSVQLSYDSLLGLKQHAI